MKKIFFILLFIILHFTFINENCEAQWEPDVRLTNDSDKSQTTTNNARCIAANGNYVHVVWDDLRDGNFEIYYKRSIDEGITWGPDIRLTNSTSYSYRPSVAVSGSIIHIVWDDNRSGNFEIYYKHSTNGGTNWGPDIRLTNATGYSVRPSFIVSDSVLHIVWQDIRDGNYEIYYKRSTDGGTNWGPDIRLTNAIGESEYPSVSISGSVLNIVWQDNRDGNYEIYNKRSTDGGTNWGADIRLTNSVGESLYPCVSTSGSVVHIAWSDDRDGDLELFYKRSTDGGTNWGADIQLTNIASESRYPSVIVSGSIVHIVWQDDRDGNFEVYYKRSMNEGSNWETDLRLTNAPGVEILVRPSVLVYGLVVHVVWTDDRDGNDEIYYKRNPTGNLTGIKNISTEIPSSFSLGQNYPNPFNAVTKIKLQVASKKFVKLGVYDLMGREVRTLVDEELKAGVYEVRFDSGDLPSGVYFYRMEAGSFTETRKLILLK